MKRLFMNIKKFIKHHFFISKMLKITPFRPVFIVPSWYQFKSGDYGGVCIKLQLINFCVICLKVDTVDNMIITHAHELWHVYQMKYDPQILEQEPDQEIPWQYKYFAYQNKPHEIEANSFAYFYGKNFGLDVDKFFTDFHSLIEDICCQISLDNYVTKIEKQSEEMKKKYINYIQESEEKKDVSME